MTKPLFRGLKSPTRIAKSKRLPIALLLCASLAACSDNDVNVALSSRYVQPAASQLDHDALRLESYREASRFCRRGGGSNRGFGIRSSGVAASVVKAVVVKLVDIVGDKASEKLKGYVTNETFVTELKFKPGLNCVEVDRNNETVLLLQSRVYTSGGQAYGMKLRPIWFDPAAFKPKEGGKGDDPQMALAMAVTPTYFVRHERLVGLTQQVLLTKFPEAEATAGGFFVPTRWSAGWEDWPMLAGPPTGQISTLKVEIAAGVKPPAGLVFLNEQLARNGNRLGNNVAKALSK